LSGCLTYLSKDVSACGEGDENTNQRHPKDWRFHFVSLSVCLQ
jgi:hypothetical protein